MTIGNQLYTLLSTGATLATTRVYPLVAPDQVVKPYIVYQRVFGNSENVMSGNSYLTNTRMQIDMYALTYADVTTIAAQVDALMSAWSVKNVSLQSVDFYETETKLFRIAADYSLWH
jgi:hypothetical protein